MKKILIYAIFCFTFLGFSACKKTELSPQEQLNNTFWTGFFNYEPLREAQYGNPLTQPFAIQFLSNGRINWYEASGAYGGKWVLVDQTITITQDNKNIITLSYIDGKIGFVKIVGPPAKWIASRIEKYNPETDKPKSNTVWISEMAYKDILYLFDVDSNPKLEFGTYRNIPIEVKNNMIIVKDGDLGFVGATVFIIIRNDKLYFMYTPFSTNKLSFYPDIFNRK
jgi:hypothetical protein